MMANEDKKRRGRRMSLTTKQILDLFAEKGKLSISQIAKVFDISVSTVERRHAELDEIEVKAALAKYEAKLLAIDAEKQKVIVADLEQCEEYSKFLARHASEGTSPNTMAKYTHLIKTIAATIANQGVYITPKKAKKFARPSSWTIDQLRQAITTVPDKSKFNMVVAIRSIRSDLKIGDDQLKTKKLKQFQKKHVTENDYFNEDEVKQILSEAKKRGLMYFALNLYGRECATRSHGTRNAKWIDVSFFDKPLMKGLQIPFVQDGVIAWKTEQVVVAGGSMIVKEKTTETYNKLMSVQLCDALKQLKIEAKTPYVFEFEGKQLTASFLNKQLRELCNLANIKKPHIHWHLWRHTFGTLCKKHRVPDSAAIKQGGWKTIQTYNENYITVSTEDQAEAMIA
jgi:integrase